MNDIENTLFINNKSYLFGGTKNILTEIYFMADIPDNFMNEYEKILDLKDIVIIGYYSSDYNYEKYINYFNKKLYEIAKENNIIFIDTNEMYQNKNLSYEKEEIDVATEIIKIIEEVLLK